MRRMLGVAIVCLGTLAVCAQTASPGAQTDLEHTQWVDNVLRSIQEIRVGNTRSDLLRVFTTEGGLFHLFTSHIRLSSLSSHQGRCRICGGECQGRTPDRQDSGNLTALPWMVNSGLTVHSRNIAHYAAVNKSTSGNNRLPYSPLGHFFRIGLYPSL